MPKRSREGKESKEEWSPYQPNLSTDNGKLKRATKAYKNLDFLNSHSARQIRILCEFAETQKRLEEQNIYGTILVFGSARSMYPEDYKKTLSVFESELADPKTDPAKKAELSKKIQNFKKIEWMGKWVVFVEELCYRLTEWSINSKEAKEVLGHLPNYFFPERGKEPAKSDQPFVIATGGGSGLMEAANKGAARVASAKTIGMSISLPFEHGLNPYITDGLGFEFHYFFTRKFWMMFTAKAVIVSPGGFGTMDEFFELLTLIQTRKLPPIPIVLICKQYWKTIVNWQALADFGTISQEDVDNLFFADTIDDAFNYLTEKLMAMKMNSKADGKIEEKKK